MRFARENPWEVGICMKLRRSSRNYAISADRVSRSRRIVARAQFNCKPFGGEILRGRCGQSRGKKQGKESGSGTRRNKGEREKRSQRRERVPLPLPRSHRPDTDGRLDGCECNCLIGETVRGTYRRNCWSRSPSITCADLSEAVAATDGPFNEASSKFLSHQFNIAGHRVASTVQ